MSETPTQTETEASSLVEAPPPAEAPSPDEEPRLSVQFEDEVFELVPGAPFDVGRDADLSLPNNKYLHRRFLRLEHNRGFWWLSNIGSSMAATVSDPLTGTQAWLCPGARLPISYAELQVVFTAGPCTYRITLVNHQPVWHESGLTSGPGGDTTIAAMPLTAAQRIAIVALAEPMLRREGPGVVVLPSNAEAAQRLGWNLTRFNRKLDNICDKLDRLGVDGLRGGIREHATNRRARLIEWAVSTGVVTAGDLELLPTEINPDPDLDDDSF